MLSSARPNGFTGNEVRLIIFYLLSEIIKKTRVTTIKKIICCRYKHAQCGNCRFFLSFRFYRKSKLTKIWKFKIWNLIVYEFLNFLKAEIDQIKIQSPWNGKTIFILQNWFHVKSKRRENPKICTPWRVDFAAYRKKEYNVRVEKWKIYFHW